MRPAPAHTQNARAIFTAAMAIADPEDRCAFLKRMCGREAQFQHRVEALLAAAQLEESNPLDHVTELFCGTVECEPGWTADGVLDESPPAVIGPYRVIRPLGEGGMGVVFEAEQVHPVRRTVAIKLIKPGMDSRELISRFRTEQEALALMNHPNIARVIDAGVAAGGRPFFVMEYVEGQKITDFCEEHRLTIPARLQLFQQVCRAVQHAHQKGIIHRDLKPGNLLVSLQDEAPVVKVIDFGVAKAMRQAVGGNTIWTHGSQVLGTPMYMSPEQAERGNQDIDTRSDVYALGVILYELLTGTTPIDRSLISSVGMDEVYRLIRHSEPRRPSERITVPMKRDATGGGRDPAVAGIAREDLRGELDWIVMKALEKDRTRRYQSAGRLSEDIQRFLDHEPVEACPPTRLYLVHKFVRRHRGVLTTAAIVLMALLSGLALATWQAVVATQARKVADERLERETTARREADQERDRANAAAEQSRRLLYASDMAQALRAWHRNDVVRKRELLSRHIPVAGQQDLRGFEWQYLWNQTSFAPQMIAQSEHPFYFCEFSPDGLTLAASGGDDRIRLFDAQTFALLMELEAGQKEVNGLAFTADSGTLASAGDDGTIALWDLKSRSLLRRFAAHEDAAYQVRFIDQDQSIVTCGNDNDLRLWRVADGSSLGSLQHHEARVDAIATSSNGLLTAASKSGHYSVWNIVGRTMEYSTGSAAAAAVNAIAVSPDDELLATGQSSGMFAIRRLEDGLVVGMHPVTDSIHSVAFSPGRREQTRFAAVGDRSGLIHLFPFAIDKTSTGLPLLETQRQSWRWQAHQGRVFGMAVSPDGRRLITAGEDGRLCQWNLERHHATRVLQSNTDDLLSLGEDRLLTSQNGTLTDLDLAATRSSRIQARPLKRPLHIWFASAAKRVFAVTSDFGEVLSWPLTFAGDHENCFVELRSRPGETFKSFAVTPDGSRFAVVVADSADQCWLQIGELEAQQRIPCALNSHPVCSPDGRLFVYSKEKDLFLVDSTNGASLGVLKGHRTTIEGSAFSPDGAFLATVSRDRTVRVWDLNSCEQLWSETAHANECHEVAFAPDGQTIATSGGDGMLRLWRWRDAIMTFELPLAEWPLSHLMFSEDGLRVIVREKESRNVRVYDAVPVMPAGNDHNASALPDTRDPGTSASSRVDSQ